MLGKLSKKNELSDGGSRAQLVKFHAPPGVILSTSWLPQVLSLSVSLMSEPHPLDNTSVDQHFRKTWHSQYWWAGDSPEITGNIRVVFPVGGIDEIRIVLADIGKRGVIVWCIRTVGPIIQVQYCWWRFSTSILCFICSGLFSALVSTIPL